MTTQNLPDLETILCNRLVICVREITGVKKVFEEAPELSQDLSTLPYAYPLIGPSPLPVTSGGSAIFTLNISFVLAIWPFSAGSQAAAQGAEANKKAKPFYSRFRNYFLEHPRLDTEGTNEAAKAELGLVQDLGMAHSGLTTVGAAGVSLSAIFFDFTILARVKVRGLS